LQDFRCERQFAEQVFEFGVELKVGVVAKVKLVDFSEFCCHFYFLL
jgi:hypothetical protein